MSNSSTTLLDRSADVGFGVEALRRGFHMAAAPLRFVSFWAAVALPFLYLPLLVGGLEGQQALVFLGLLLLNAVALLLGHNHGSDAP